MSVNSDILAGIIYGRVEPHIYAFTTQTVPNYLKVGDTYRPVQVRLDEWRKRYDNLKKEFEHTAKVSDNTYFRDFAVHAFLESKDFRRIERYELEDGVYFSNEFFRDACDKDVQEAIDDIKASFANKDNRYAFYNTEDRLPMGEVDYERNADWLPRENQQEVINAFMKAVNSGRTNLLMYAVMRFGKSFTSLCCAKAMDAKLVVVVCGKTAVRDEWKSNVQRPKILEGYHFVTTDTLRANPNTISDLLAEGGRAVVFLTLQDLLGEDVKERHRDLFAHNQLGHIDLLIIDESHFAARSEETGKVLNGIKTQNSKKEQDAYDQDFAELEEPIKLFTPKIKLHLSGTPYRILMDGEFQKEDIIAFVQYNDIIDEQKKWDDENIERDEWENPYYGFPQMIRFAFNLNQSAIDRLNEMRNDGIDYRLNTLLEANNKKFKYESEVLDLLKAIDGSKEDENIFSFLNYDRIKEGMMCRHIVMVLPYRASCDAMKKMLSANTFANLGEYEVLNLAGVDCPARYKGTDYAIQIKTDIDRLESRGKKTITLTVGKMLTGSTVSQWDTMIFLKDASSPQEYDQAIFRLQSQYVKTIKSDDGNEIKYNMKPQTLLVDFDPTRMFVMQNRKSLISNINTSIRGNEELEERLHRELEISPIIFLNKGKLQRVEPNNIIDAVRRYSANKSIMDETFDVIVDDGVFDDTALKIFLEKEKEMSVSGNIFTTKPNEGEGDDVDTDGSEVPTTDENPDTQEETPKEKLGDNELKSLRKKLQTYYFKLLLFAYLSDGEEKTLTDIIHCIENDENGKRIARNLQLNVEVVKMIREKIHPMALNELENKINNVDTLGEDLEANVQAAMRRFSRLSSSEITTPEWVAKKMVDTLPDDVTAQSRFLNIAGKIGEFEYALCNRYGDEVKRNIYTIPTSGVTYECTRKVCRMLGIPTENVFEDFTSYDLIDNTKNENIMERLNTLNFEVALGNPPYQENDGGNGASATPIYHKFAGIAKAVNSKFVTMIMPARWYAGGKGLNQFRAEMLNDRRLAKIVDYTDSKDCFGDVDVAGGICYFLWDRHYDGPCDFTNILKGKSTQEMRQLNEYSILVRYSIANKILKKISSVEGLKMDSQVSSRKPFGLATNFQPNAEGDVCLKTNKGLFKTFRSSITEGTDMIDKWKVIISYLTAEHAGMPDKNGQFKVLSTNEILPPNHVCTETYLVAGSFDDECQAKNFHNYIRTKFARFMVQMTLAGQHITKSNFQFVPILDFTKSWTDEELFIKYGFTEDEIEFIESMIKTMD